MPEEKTVQDMYRGKQPPKKPFAETLMDGRFVLDRITRYGENPGSAGAFYKEVEASGPCLAEFEMLQENPGKEMSFNNFLDASAAITIVADLHELYPNECIVDVIKHTNPTGVTRSDDPTKSLLISWETDPTSAYGGIICSSNYVDESFAQGLVDKYIELLIAPGFTGGAMDILRKKGDLRVMRIEGFDKPLLDDGYDYKKVRGGLLVQERNISRIRGPENLETVSERYPISDEQEAGPFLWRIAKNTKSNAIVVGYKDRVLGVGEGQPNRYDSAYIAIKLRRDKYTQAKDGILASDAFFPYPDTVKLAGESGITAIIFPLGSIRDQEAIDMGNKYNMAMMVTRPIPGDKKTIERGFFH